MTTFYGSKAKPEEVFGVDTKELKCFYEVIQELLQGAWECREDMVELWQSWELEHKWTLPDGYVARVKVIKKNKVGIEVDELDHHKFTHTFFENVGLEKYISLPANIIHSIDGYMVREMGRRCNYDVDLCHKALDVLENEFGILPHEVGTDFTKIISMVSIHNIDEWVETATRDEAVRLYQLIRSVVSNSSFELVCIHDAFKCHANHVNTLRYWYKEILAEFAESNLLGDIFSEIEGYKVVYDKLSDPAQFAKLIRNSEYCIC